jgi:hypothetical protein
VNRWPLLSINLFRYDFRKFSSVGENSAISANPGTRQGMHVKRISEELRFNFPVVELDGDEMTRIIRAMI